MFSHSVSSTFCVVFTGFYWILLDLTFLPLEQNWTTSFRRPRRKKKDKFYPTGWDCKRRAKVFLNGLHISTICTTTFSFLPYLWISFFTKFLQSLTPPPPKATLVYLCKTTWTTRDTHTFRAITRREKNDITYKVGIWYEVPSEGRSRIDFDRLYGSRPCAADLGTHAIELGFGLVFEPLQVIDDTIAERVVQRLRNERRRQIGRPHTCQSPT